MKFLATFCVVFLCLCLFDPSHGSEGDESNRNLRSAGENGNSDSGLPKVIVVPGFKKEEGKGGPPDKVLHHVEKFKGKGAAYFVPEDLSDEETEEVLASMEEYPDHENAPEGDDVPGEDGRMLDDADGKRHLGVNHWTNWRSEETPMWKAYSCNDMYPGNTHLAVGMACRGNYCDDVRLACDLFGTHELGRYQVGMITNIVYSGVQTCPSGYYISNVFCYGAVCSGLRFWCERWTSAAVYTDCFWGGWYSEEGSGTRVASSDGWRLVGIRCSGTYCDNKQNMYCKST